MASNTGRLRAVLNNSKIQTSNNSLYQAIIGLIDEVEGIEKVAAAVALEFGKRILALEDVQINLIEVDTSVAPQTIILDDIVRAFTIIKDISGNASVNNITLTGTVDGVTDPVISVDWGLLKIYRHIDGTFYSWDNTINQGGGGGGEDGTGGCDGYTNHVDVVTAKRADYVTGGGTFATDQSILDIAIAVATALVGVDGAGLLQKTSGAAIATYGGTYVSISRICYPDGTIFKILTDAGVGGANGAAWNCDGRVDPTRFVPI